MNYYDNPRVSNSDIGELIKSYEDFLYARANKKSSEAMDLGSALHCLILEPEEFNKRFTYEKPDLRTNIGKARKIEIEEQGLITLSPEQKSSLTGMFDALKSNPLASSLLWAEGADYEKEIYWQYEGVDCRSKLDCVNSDFIIDLKTVAGFTKELLNPKNRYFEGFPQGEWNIKDCLRFIMLERNHFRQARFYQLAEFADSGVPKDFIFIYVSSSAPHSVYVVKTDGSFDELADLQIMQGLNEYKKNVNIKLNESIITLSKEY